MALRRVLSSCVSSWGAALREGKEDHWSTLRLGRQMRMRKGSFGMGFERVRRFLYYMFSVRVLVDDSLLAHTLIDLR